MKTFLMTTTGLTLDKASQRRSTIVRNALRVQGDEALSEAYSRIGGAF